MCKRIGVMNTISLCTKSWANKGFFLGGGGIGIKYAREAFK